MGRRKAREAVFKVLSVLQESSQRTRPQSAFVRRSTQLEFEVAGKAIRDSMECFDPLTFRLPGGSPADIKDVFETTFGMELPNFDKKVVCILLS